MNSAPIIDSKDIDTTISSSVYNAGDTKSFSVQLSDNNLLINCTMLSDDLWEIKFINIETGTERMVEKKFDGQQTIAMLHFIIAKEKADSLSHDRLRREGVTDADIKWWTNLSDDAKQKIKNIDSSFRSNFTRKCVEELHLSGEEAIKKTMENYALYDDYPLSDVMLAGWNSMGFVGDSAPLPYELHNRVDKYLAKIGIKSILKGKKQFQEEKKSFLSLNAFIRSKISKGEL